MKLTRWTIALYVALVFVSGAVMGAFGYRLYTVSAVSAANTRPSPEEFRKRYMEEMRSRLKLSDDQASKLSAILDESRSRVRMTRESIEPVMQKIREDQQAAVHSLLSAQQVSEYEKMRQERDAEMKKRGGPPPPPPGR